MVSIVRASSERTNRENYVFFDESCNYVFLRRRRHEICDPTTAGYGLVFRLVDAQNFRFFWITANGRYTVGKVVDDHALPIKPWTDSGAIRRQGENALRVELCADLMNIFINGEKVAVLQDDTFPQGGYGFYTHGGAHVGYDDLFVVAGSPFELHMPQSGTMEAFRGMTGTTFSLQLTGSDSGSIWGSDVYTDDSDLATAAVHAGVLEDGQTGTVAITVRPGQESYQGSQRNGVASQGYGAWHGSYRIERLQ